MELIAVIDTETTWNDLVMSIGTVVTRGDNFPALDAKYHVLTPEMDSGGMYETALSLEGLADKSRDSGLQRVLFHRAVETGLRRGGHVSPAQRRP